MVVEVRDPGEGLYDAHFHRVGHVGEYPGLDPRALQAGSPVDHLLVRLRPEADICCDQFGQSLRAERLMQVVGDDLPVGPAGQCAAIVVVAMAPVGLMEGRFVGGEDALQALPGGWVRGAGENHSEVEEDGVDRWF